MEITSKTQQLKTQVKEDQYNMDFSDNDSLPGLENPPPQPPFSEDDMWNIKMNDFIPKNKPLKEHSRKGGAPGRWQCICKQQFFVYRTLLEHIRTSHHAFYNKVRKVGRLTLFLAPPVQHQDGGLISYVTEKPLDKAYGFRRWSKNRQVIKFECFCGTVNYYENLKYHMRKYHPLFARYACGRLKKDFVSLPQKNEKGEVILKIRVEEGSRGCMKGEQEVKKEEAERVRQEETVDEVLCPKFKEIMSILSGKEEGADVKTEPMSRQQMIRVKEVKLSRLNNLRESYEKMIQLFGKLSQLLPRSQMKGQKHIEWQEKK